LTTTHKHTPAGTRAEVRERCTVEAVADEVNDDGAATDRTPQAGGSPSGHGIPGMRERAAAYGATLEAGPLPHGGGWRVSARLGLGTVGDDAA
jgi:signal transduction histidine kinase